MWEPPWGIEPQTYALRVRRGSSTGVHPDPAAQLSGIRMDAGFHSGPQVSSPVVSIRVSKRAASLPLPPRRVRPKFRWKPPRSWATRQQLDLSPCKGRSSLDRYPGG